MSNESSNLQSGAGVEIERLRWLLAEVRKEVTAINPDWKRVMRLFDEAGPCNSDASLVVRVCTAYEQGFGQAGRALTNPYELLSAEAEAWNIGWQEGKKRSAPETSRDPATCTEKDAARYEFLRENWPALVTTVVPRHGGMREVIDLQVSPGIRELSFDPQSLDHAIDAKLSDERARDAPKTSPEHG